MGFNDCCYSSRQFWRENWFCDCPRTYFDVYDGNVGHSLGSCTSKWTETSDHKCVGFSIFMNQNLLLVKSLLKSGFQIDKNPLNVILVNHFCLLETFIITIFFMAIDRETKTVPKWIQKGISRLEKCFNKQKIKDAQAWL